MHRPEKHWKPVHRLSAGRKGRKPYTNTLKGAGWHKGKGANPQRVSTEIIYEIKQLNYMPLSKVYGVPTVGYLYHRKWTFFCINLFIF